jgi:hypothetical protein
LREVLEDKVFFVVQKTGKAFDEKGAKASIRGSSSPTLTQPALLLDLSLTLLHP